MSDIYNTLSKHFCGEASEEENKKALHFKAENEKEYNALKLFYSKKGSDSFEYDKSKAWQNIVNHAPKTKVISWYPTFRRVASVAAIIAIVFTSALLILKENSHSDSIIELIAGEINQKVVLPDGTTVFLNANSRISYPELFDAKIRTVSIEGEAFFEVIRDTLRPFLIHTPHSDVEVLGTSFNINTENRQTEVAVRTGKVKVLSLSQDKSAVLLPKSIATITNNELRTKQVDNENYLAWKTGHFVFNETPLAEAVVELNTYYANKIVLHDTTTNCRLTADFEQRGLAEILEILSLTSNLTIKKNNGIYELQ